MILSFFKKVKKTVQTENNNTDNIEYPAIAMTDKGAVRTQNQDSVLFVKPFDKHVKSTKGCLAVVADGMGGHNSGEVASLMATELFSSEYFKSQVSIIESLEKAFEFTNRKIFQAAQNKTQFKGMGTTFSGVVIWQDNLYIIHIGDSRVYMISENEINQITKDHTYVQHLIDTKVITESERDNHPNGNVITKALGTQKNAKADIFKAKQKFTKDDKIIICSDGLYEYIKDEELKDIVLNNQPEAASQKLIITAKNRGGHDNISVLIVSRKVVKNNSRKDTLEIL
jgi:protein phosphatase